MAKDQAQKDLEQEAKDRAAIPKIDETVSTGEATYKRYKIYRLTIHNKDYAMGCHYPEDDWTITCYGRTIDELIQNAAIEIIDSRICWDYSSFEIIQRTEFYIGGELVSVSEIEIPQVQPEPTTQVDKVISTVKKQEPRDAIHRLIHSSDTYKELLEKRKEADEAAKAKKKAEEDKKKEEAERKQYEKLRKKYEGQDAVTND